jgi:uncharacterized protein YutD
LQKSIKKFFLHPRWKLVLKTLPFVVVVVLLKLLIHYFNYEFLPLNALFTAVISANIFLIGFLISGVLVDYKESEKIPGDLAASLEAMADEGYIIYKNKNSKVVQDYLTYLSGFNRSLVDWFYKKEKTENIMKKLSGLNDYFLEFESLTQANFIVRLKQEQNNIRKILNRTHTIRETSFLGTGYAIAEIITFILILGMIFIKIDPFYADVFFVSFVSFILIYMIFFIKDIDNPFDYKTENNYDEVSLKPLLDTNMRIAAYISTPASRIID